MNEVINLASRFRKAIEMARDNGEFDKDISFYHFPRACCGDTCDLLGQYFLDNGIESVYVCGNYYSGNEWDNGQSHAWLIVDGNIIDITGDQFSSSATFLHNNTPVYVGMPNDFYKLFEVHHRDIHKIVPIGELGPFAVPRLMRLYSIILSFIDD